MQALRKGDGLSLSPKLFMADIFGGELMKKGTGGKIAKIASRVLDNPASSKLGKVVAGSALTQSKNPNERTSAKAAAAASKIMQDGRYSEDAKTLAGSVLSQRKK